MLLRTLFYLVSVCSAWNAVPPMSVLAEANRNFGLYYLSFYLLALVVGVVGWWRSKERAGFVARVMRLMRFVLCIGFIALYLRPFIDPLTVNRQPKPSDQKLSVLFIDESHAASEVAALVTEFAPTIVVVQGAPPSPNVTSRYAVHAETTPRDARTKLSLYSALPVEGEFETENGPDATPVLKTRLIVSPGRVIEFVATDVHFPSPLETPSHRRFANRFSVRRVVTPLRHSVQDGIVVASLQAPRYSPLYSIFSSGAGFIDTERIPTFTRENASLLPLTHVMYRGALSVLRHERRGSHVMVTFSVATQSEPHAPFGEE